MENNNRIIELLADMLQEQRLTNSRLEKLEKQQIKTNAALGELRLSVMQLANKFETVAQIDKRVTRLEDAVFQAH